MSMQRGMCSSKERRSDAGFTLVEALVAIVVLVFGLMAVTNLLLIAGSSNTVANQSSAATAVASQIMDDIQAVSFEALVAGGAAAFAGPPPACATPAGTPPADFCRIDNVQGVGTIRTYWQITPITSNSYFVMVRSEGTGALAGARSRAEFTTYRTCSLEQGTNPATQCPL